MGGKNWLNPLAVFSSSSSSASSPAPVAAPVTPSPVVAGEPATMVKPTVKKRRQNTVLTTMAGDLSSANTLNRTLGGA